MSSRRILRRDGGRGAARLHRAALVLGLLLLTRIGAADITAREAPRAQPGPARHVIIISIDGLRPTDYLPDAPHRAQMPVLQSLRERGSWAEGVVGQYPSLTYPSHTSIATGVPPAKHGIVHNTKFDPERGSNAWYFDSSAIRVSAIWDVAKAAGLTTAGVSWPVTVGASIDYLIPETHQNPPDMTWVDLVRRQSTPGLIDAVWTKLDPTGPATARSYHERDDFSTAAAVHIIETWRPNLMLVHLVEVDGARHSRGPDSPDAYAALENVDARLGDIVRAAERAGIIRDTAFVVTGDHGFYRVHSVFQPNVVLRDAGLLEVGADGRITSWQAVAHRGTIRLKHPDDRELAARVERLFRGLADGRYKGLFRVVGRDEIARFGGDPDAFLILEPIEGFSIAGGTAGEFLISTPRRGDHGYIPTEPRMHTGLVISGAGVLQGVVVPLTRQIDIAPTAARLLGLDFSEADGVPIAGVLEAPQTQGH